jgi:ribonucleoside-diphosphate reductase alpha chain
MINNTNKKSLTVTKRSGDVVPLDYDKIHTMIDWACSNLKNVSASQLAVSAGLQFYDKMPTKRIHDTLIQAAANLITEDAPDYQYVAARLLLTDLRKAAHGAYNPPHLLEILKKNISLKVYSGDLTKNYSEEEIDTLNSAIKYDRDLDFAYAGLKEFAESYLVKHKTKNLYYETPQIAYMVIAMTIFSVEDTRGSLFTPTDTLKEKRLKLIIELYNALSTFKISLPTPIMANCRTPIKQFASCTLIDCGDSIESIFTTAHAIGRYITKGAGIGLNLGRIRGDGSITSSGLGYSTGCIPFYKLMESATNSCSQGGIRKGSSTVFFPFWHTQVEDLIPLKDSRGTESNRIHGLDYAVQLHRLFYERVKTKQDITLFCPSEVPDLYEAFFQNRDKFMQLYTEYENKKSLKKRTISAKDLLDLIVRVRSETGRLYIHNVDNSNEYGSFKTEIAPVYQSNLCMEILLPTKPLKRIDETNTEGLIALCTLGAVNLGKIKDLDTDMEEATRILVRALDNLLIYQNYPIPAAEKFGKDYRSLGVGVSNLAYYLAKNGLKYSSPEAISLVHNMAEALQYYLLKASNSLAQERGKCAAFYTTKYADGILPIDKYKETVDILYPKETFRQNWEELRGKIKEYGLRHTVLSAIMPVEKSSIISNATNGIEAPRAYISIKNNKNSGSIPMVVPDYSKYKKSYQLTWDTDYSNKAYINLVAVIQKFIDQSISADLYYNPIEYKELVGDIFYAYKMGLKTLYYSTTKDGSGEKHSIDKTDTTKTNAGEKASTSEESKTPSMNGCFGGACTL